MNYINFLKYTNADFDLVFNHKLPPNFVNFNDLLEKKGRSSLFFKEDERHSILEVSYPKAEVMYLENNVGVIFHAYKEMKIDLIHLYILCWLEQLIWEAKESDINNVLKYLVEPKHERKRNFIKHRFDQPSVRFMLRYKQKQ